QWPVNRPLELQAKSIGYVSCRTACHPFYALVVKGYDNSMSRHPYFATCARGLEPVLAQELRALKANDVEPGRGGVGFRGDQALLYQANLWLRTAIRVLRPV